MTFFLIPRSVGIQSSVLTDFKINVLLWEETSSSSNDKNTLRDRNVNIVIIIIIIISLLNLNP